ncbi:hypothetical protein FE257_010335 [Aspergillus nanangensis]|uniref:Uncharacterized protein n=1 Tax=Aspergillus nanangensis TaxID=2582783 RepID=A0AAD4CIV8_ASPNN|nr:hypothetical protein FE257_010335 [Aspergillus nanangensis]
MHSILLLLATAATAAAAAAAVSSADPPTFSFDQLWALENNLWTNFLYPANIQQINATDDSVFADNVQGRVDITRTFDGRELNNEYIFGLFSQPDSVSLTGIPIAYNITQFTANQNIASATTVVTFNATTVGVIVPLAIDTWMAFDAHGKIVQYDVTFRWFDYLLDSLLLGLQQKYNTTDPATVQRTLAQTLATTICEVAETSCTGTNLQYRTRDECMQFLTGETRFGKAYELGRNTLLCREVHKHMVQYRPDEHCAHIGPSGGNMCVDDMSYGQVVTQAYFSQSWVANGYADDNMWVSRT